VFSSLSVYRVDNLVTNSVLRSLSLKLRANHFRHNNPLILCGFDFYSAPSLHLPQRSKQRQLSQNGTVGQFFGSELLRCTFILLYLPKKQAAKKVAALSWGEKYAHNTVCIGCASGQNAFAGKRRMPARPD
jgi:hypothetical protein